jgi:MoaA/NifB/PqqE/SkfB family radical SAM enzyme
MLKAVQIDVNGLCNSGCWFCPVSYAGNPESAKRDMSIRELENILIQLTEGKGDFVDPDLDTVYSANYNEVLLYPHFEDMLKLYKQYGFKTFLLSNGVALTKQKIEIINRYPEVVKGLLLNIPASDPDSWAEYTNMNKSLFKHVVANVAYASKTLTHFTKESWSFILMVNGVDNRSLTDNGGWLDLLDGAPKLDLDEHTGTLKQHVKAFEEMFPAINVVESYHLYDRAAHLETFKIMTQRRAIEKYLKPKGSRVIGCAGGLGVKSRTDEWVHINPNGDLFICCADYFFETVYGNVNKTSLKDIWNSKERQDMIQESYSKMCTKCSAAVWGD